jgi:hypothetical protein
MKNIWPMALSPTTATANQRASWLPAHTPSATRVIAGTAAGPVHLLELSGGE